MNDALVVVVLSRYFGIPTVWKQWKVSVLGHSWPDKLRKRANAYLLAGRDVNDLIAINLDLFVSDAAHKRRRTEKLD